MKSDTNDQAGSDSQVVDLASFRKKKDIAEELTRSGRSPLYVSHLSGKVSGQPQNQKPASPDFGDRLQRIRSSLEKINKLMSELKKMSVDGDKATTTPAAAPSSSSTRSKL